MSEAPPVAGTVQLMTDEPVEVPRVAPGSGTDVVAQTLSRRPWLVPAILMGVGVAYLLLRRRR